MEDFEIMSLGDEGNERDNGGSSVSAAKLKANRKNARRSTGPKTEAGKNHSRQNALKHGVLASALLVKKGGGAEDASEFEELLSSLNRDLAPVGRLEEMMVEKIAVCWWRQKRALRYEALMIRRASGDDSPELCQERELALYSMIHGLRPESVAEAIVKIDSQLDQVIYHFGLPKGAEMNRILRYEASIQRQLAHAINQLERLQRARKGEHVPAPITLQISTDRST